MTSRTCYGFGVKKQSKQKSLLGNFKCGQLDAARQLTRNISYKNLLIEPAIHHSTVKQTEPGIELENLKCITNFSRIKLNISVLFTRKLHSFLA